MQLPSKILTLTLLTSALMACGGGRSSDPAPTQTPDVSTPSPTPNISTPSPTPEVTPSPTPTLTPTPDIISAYSLQNMYGKVTNNSAIALVNTVINISIVNTENEELLALSTQTDESGNYEFILPEVVSQTPIQIKANFFKEGFTEGERSIPIAAEQVSLSLDTILSQVINVSIKRSELDALAFGADGEARLQLSLVKTQDGKQKLLVGGAQAAEGADTQLGLSIPSSNLPESIEVINGELAYFDSSDENDIQNFPGEFIGVGETELQGEGVSFNRNDTEADEYRLISSTFSQIKLTDQNGEPLQLSDVQGADGTNPNITLKIPRGSYPTIEKDFDLTVEGIQIPIFVYKSSDGWQYVGNGLLVDILGTEVSAEHPANAPVVTAEDGSLNLNNYPADLYVSVEITEANQWLKWINLDWPIKPTTDVAEVCFNGTASYSDGESYSGMTGVRLPDGGFEWLYIKNGQFSLNSVFSLSPELAANPDNWEFTIRNAKTGQSEVVALPQIIETGGVCNDISISLFNPYICEVTGQLFESDGETPIGNQRVTTVVNNIRATLITNENGAYQQSVACDDPFSVGAFGQETSESVSLASSPITINFSKANQPPILGLSSGGVSSVSEDETMLIKWRTSDPEDDPVTVNIESCTSGENECTWEKNTSDAQLTFSTHGHYELLVSANDGTNTVTRELEIDVKKLGNQSPKISGFLLNEQFYDAGSHIELVVAQQVALSVLATDINGDELSYQWSGLNCSANECAVDSESPGTHSLSVVVTDNHEEDPLSSSAALRLSFAEDLAPKALLLVSAKVLSEVDGANGEAVKAFLQTTDDLTPHAQLSTSWSLMLGAEDHSSKLSLLDNFNATIAIGDLVVGEYQLSATVSDTNINGQAGLSTMSTQTLVVTDDLAPVLILNSSANKIFSTLSGADASLRVSANISDDNTPIDELELSWAVTPEVSFTPSADNRSISIDAKDLVAADYVITATLVDSNQQQTTRKYLVSVVLDQAPQITGLIATPVTQTASESSQNSLPIEVVVGANDDFSEALDIAWQITPNVQWEAIGNKLTIPASSIGIGQYTVQVDVTDSRGQVSTKSALFDVKQRDGNVEIIID